MAVIGFWVLDVANNTVQGPCRALLNDLAPDQMPLANACLAACLSLGNVSGYVCGWQGKALLSALPFFGTTTRLLFTFSCVFLAITCVVTFVVAREKQHRLTAEQLVVNRPFRDLPKALWESIKRMPVCKTSRRLFSPKKPSLTPCIVSVADCI